MRKPLFDLDEPFIEPMKAHLGTTKDLDHEGYIYEPKLDGIRALCYMNEVFHLFSRNARDITSEYPDFNFRKAIKAKSAILDGEIVALDEMMSPRFHLWQMGQSSMYVVFDILMLNGKYLFDVPLLERKKLLDKVLTDQETIEKVFYTTQGEALWQEMLKRNMEGVMAKKPDSLYYPGKRSWAWIKIKAFKTLEAVIVGYMPGKRVIGSLALGIYDKHKNLHYIGNVGTGFTEAFLVELFKKLHPLETKTNPTNTIVKGMVWIKPLLVAEVRYLEFTNAGILRAASFQKLRDDKKASDITFNDQELREPPRQ